MPFQPQRHGGPGSMTSEVIAPLPASCHIRCDGIRVRSPPMHQLVSANQDASRRWWVLAIVVAAQFMFGVDAFIVNVAIPTIAVELHASPAQIEAVIAIYLIAYATLVVTGGRLGDIYGTKNVFLAGVFGFSITSLWCGLAQSGPELIIARLAQGPTAALVVPQGLATLHLFFTDSACGRALGIFGIVAGPRVTA